MRRSIWEWIYCLDGRQRPRQDDWAMPQAIGGAAMCPQASQTQRTDSSANHMGPLTELKNKESAIIRDLAGGAGFRSRLAALGFTPGAEITMLQNRGHGPIIVTLRDTRIALGRGEAQKILVVSK